MVLSFFTASKVGRGSGVGRDKLQSQGGQNRGPLGAALRGCCIRLVLLNSKAGGR